MASETASPPETRGHLIAEGVEGIKKFNKDSVFKKGRFQVRNEDEAGQVLGHARSLISTDASRDIDVVALHQDMNKRLGRADKKTVNLLTHSVLKNIHQAAEEGDQAEVVMNLRTIELLGLDRVIGRAGGEISSYFKALTEKQHLGKMYPQTGMSRRKAIGLGAAAVGVVAVGVGSYEIGQFKKGMDLIASNGGVHPQPPKFEGVVKPPILAASPETKPLAPPSPTATQRALPASTPEPKATVPPTATEPATPTEEPRAIAQSTPLDNATPEPEMASSNPNQNGNGNENKSNNDNQGTPQDDQSDKLAGQMPEQIQDQDSKQIDEAELASSRVEKEIGDANYLEFFFGGLIEELKGKGVTLWNEIPAYRDRISKEAVLSDNITFAMIGIDETARREADYSEGSLWGHGDVIIIVSINPHTLKTVAFSLPRDLLSKEVEGLGIKGPGWDKINAAMMTSLVKDTIPGLSDRVEDSDQFMQRILESATGLRIDSLLVSNIDFIEGSVDHFDKHRAWIPGQDGIIDALYPDGIPVPVTSQIVDNEYPVGYGTERVVFNPGVEVMHGDRVTRYARSRHADSDFGRSARQREVGFVVAAMEVASVFKDFASGSTNRLDTIIDVLTSQEEAGRFKSDGLDAIEVLRDLRDSYNEIKDGPGGMETLALLAKNTAPMLAQLATDRDSIFISDGLSRENGTIMDYNGTTFAVAGGDTRSGPDEYGNYLKSWAPLRQRIEELVGF